jgi:YD repeat-containing protein
MEIQGKGEDELAETIFYYDLNGNLIKQIDPMGVATYYVYDEFDRLVKTRQGQ